MYVYGFYDFFVQSKFSKFLNFNIFAAEKTVFMFRKKYIALILFCFALLSSNAQTDKPVLNETDIFSLINYPDSSGAELILYQPASLHVLVEKHIRLNKKVGVYGYRIQINQWAGQNGREVASAARIKFNEKFPEFDGNQIHTYYQAPYFRLRVGDFRNRHEAYEFYHQVKKYFPNSYIVRSRIKYPKLELVSEDLTDK